VLVLVLVLVFTASGWPLSPLGTFLRKQDGLTAPTPEV
jgi:hypothetical protein